MSYRLEKGKSFIGSLATHDDNSPKFHGGVDYCNHTTGLKISLPMINRVPVCFLMQITANV